MILDIDLVAYPMLKMKSKVQSQCSNLSSTKSQVGYISLQILVLNKNNEKNISNEMNK